MFFFIYIIAFLEGFTTLSIEIVALRKFTPIIGTNSISTSIILGIILIALSYGYYIGGKKSVSKDHIVSKIIWNLSFASLYYVLFTFIFDTYILTSLLTFTNSYFLAILISSILLFFVPVFLASQTIPLLSELLEGENVGEKIGKLLFFSTIGSFLGSVVTSTIFFPLFGVDKSANLNSLILSGIAVSIIIVYQKFNTKNTKEFFIPIFIYSLAFYALFFYHKTPLTLYSHTNSYHNIDIYETNEGDRFFIQNGGYASGISLDTKESFFHYIQEIKSQIKANPNTNVAIFGAAGFTLPQELARNTNIENITVIDIDASLKDISEKYFLQEAISPKIIFDPSPARYFLHKNKVKYDSIVVDIYIGKSLTPQTLTYEFFHDLHNQSDTVYINIITDKNLSTQFSKNLFHTMQEAFGEVYYKIIPGLEDNNKNTLANIVVSNKHLEGYTKYSGNGGEIYTDNKNNIELDLFLRNQALGVLN